jgi:hypothetical protein
MTNGARKQQPTGVADELVAESALTVPAPSAQPASPPDDGQPLDAPKPRGAELERAVPVRRRASVDGAPLRAAFLLLHVDNRMSVTQLATCAQIPLEDAIECFELLADLGVVELRAACTERVSAPPVVDEGDRSRPPTLKSGLRPKT